jgi:hypothetical protein
MPAKPSWLLAIPEMLHQLQSLDTPVVDRATCERLFQVKRRRAIGLMQTFGGYRSGNTVLVDRLALINRLMEIARTEEYDQETRRKRRLADGLNSIHKSLRGVTIRLPVRKDAAERSVDDLPLGVVLAPGKLTVEFAYPEELFAKLYELAQAATNDFERVCDAITSTAASRCNERAVEPHVTAITMDLSPSR